MVKYLAKEPGDRAVGSFGRPGTPPHDGFHLPLVEPDAVARAGSGRALPVRPRPTESCAIAGGNAGSGARIFPRRGHEARPGRGEPDRRRTARQSAPVRRNRARCRHKPGSGRFPLHRAQKQSMALRIWDTSFEPHDRQDTNPALFCHPESEGGPTAGNEILLKGRSAGRRAGRFVHLIPFLEKVQ